MIAGIVLVIIAAACLIYACFAYAKKGPLLSTMYFIATPSEKQKMKSQREYRFIATTFLLLAIVLFVFGLFFLTRIEWLKTAGNAAIIVTVFFTIIGSILSEKKHRKK